MTDTPDTPDPAHAAHAEAGVSEADPANAADTAPATGAARPAGIAVTPRPPDLAAFREAVRAWAGGGPEEPARELAGRLAVRVAVLLEGPSDLAAVNALAALRGRDLAAEGVCVLSMGGAMNVGRFARLLGPTGLGLRLTGLCDERERPYYTRGLARAGAAEHGFFVCTADLEDELIRALGPPRVAELARAEGDHRALHTFLNQPAQQGRGAQQQLRRFLGTTSGRKIHYGRVLVEALDPDRVPAPLDALLASL
ncbi:TOPRIM nucleotidyl transferase/hydrolase domain-containing protein [Streptomyces sp. NPDC047061]|uniref:TOPRIM nucleotidyl transferase/hydrolase domain-containing protein n=1 Tax=Streptomyces sp. NPDC047061 TaxID=3154605 RepID=UPI0033F40247